MRACSVAKELGFGDMKNHVRKDQVFGMFCWDMLRGLMTAHVQFRKKITPEVFSFPGVFNIDVLQYRRFARCTHWARINLKELYKASGNWCSAHFPHVLKFLAKNISKNIRVTMSASEHA
jgi:hypothetical protein